MRATTILAMLFSIGLSAASQVMLKAGMTTPTVQAALMSGGPMEKMKGIVSSPFVLTGLASYGVSAIVWLLVLSRVPLSLAYPFVSLGVIFTVLAGKVFFQEPLSGLRITAVVIICIGICVLGLSGGGLGSPTSR